MRTIVSGTVNGVAFSLKEDGKTVCKESKYCSLISEIAKKALDKTQAEIQQGLHPTAVFNIAEDLEDCKDVKIQVNKVVEYLGNTTEVHYFHLSNDKSSAKMLYLQGKFKTEGKFTILVDHTTQVIDPEGKVHKAYSNMLKQWIDMFEMRFTSPTIPSRNYEIYQAFQKEVPALQIEKACFYHYPPVPGRIY